MRGCGVLVIALLACACTGAHGQAPPGRGDRFGAFAARLAAIADSAARERAVDTMLARVRKSGTVLRGDSSATFLYRGPGRRIFVAGDANGWNPGAGEMHRVAGTSLFALTWRLDPAARCEYKIVVDSAWMLDPLNTLTVRGGFGDNSEVRMPGYVFPAAAIARQAVRRGTLDTIVVASDRLRRRLHAIVYTPAVYAASGPPLPVWYVTDGGEFLELARVNVVLDNLIAGGDIPPLVAVFIDPRDGPGGRNMRMNDYALNDAFVGAVAEEVRPFIGAHYRTRSDPAGTGIMGASMGALIATYAALTRSDVFGLCGALSPSYQWAHDTLLAMARALPRRDVRFYIATGTIRDADERARVMRDLLRAKGYDVTYDEVPESHNWLNWTGRLRRLFSTPGGAR